MQADDIEDVKIRIYDVLDEVCKDHGLSDKDFHDLLVKADVPQAVEAAMIRRDWGQALDRAQNGSDLSYPIGYGFSEQDIRTLAELHKNGQYRDKIEDLLTDCNFHRECLAFSEGRYDAYLKDPAEQEKNDENYER